MRFPKDKASSLSTLQQPLAVSNFPFQMLTAILVAAPVSRPHVISFVPMMMQRSLSGSRYSFASAPIYQFPGSSQDFFISSKDVRNLDDAVTLLDRLICSLYPIIQLYEEGRLEKHTRSILWILSAMDRHEFHTIS
uniref:Uncharacterized protein n=1 Tax=Rhizophora mucronata TaxID=61149 RepID=A0A2P2K552_RHIMU